MENEDDEEPTGKPPTLLETYTFKTRNAEDIAACRALGTKATYYNTPAYQRLLASKKEMFGHRQWRGYSTYLKDILFRGSR